MQVVRRERRMVGSWDRHIIEIAGRRMIESTAKLRSSKKITMQPAKQTISMGLQSGMKWEPICRPDFLNQVNFCVELFIR
jgi:hypothetical protein